MQFLTSYPNFRGRGAADALTRPSQAPEREHIVLQVNFVYDNIESTRCGTIIFLN